MLDKFKNRLGIVDFVGIFLVLSPFIDLITSLSVKYLGISATFGTIIRGLFLLYFVYFVFFRSSAKIKKISMIYLSLIFIYASAFLINMYFLKGTGALVIEFKQLLKTFYFPVLTIGFINYYDNRKFNFKLLKNVGFIYAILVFIPIVLGLSFPAYNSTGLGYKGWFYAANELGAIISILFPFVVYEFIQFPKDKRMYILYFIYLYVMIQIGTKVPLLALILTIFAFLGFYFLKFIIEKRKFSFKNIYKPILLPLVVSLLVIPVLFSFSPSAKIIQNRVEELENDPTKPNEEKINDFIFSSRDKYFEIVNNRFENADFKEQLLGIGYKKNFNDESNKQNFIEIDYIDIIYQYGFIGVLLYFVLILVAINNYILNKKIKIKSLFTDSLLATKLISFTLVMGIAYFAGHVFVAPSVSIYIACMFILKKEEANEE